MTKDVLIRISGIQMADGENDNVEVITSGDYFLKNGKHYIQYEEVMEGFTDAVKSTIKVSSQGMDVRKIGASHVHMSFEPNKRSIASYATPMGEMMIGINTNQISIDEAEDWLKVKVIYSLDINFDKFTDCELVLDVYSKGKADLNLTS